MRSWRPLIFAATSIVEICILAIRLCQNKFLRCFLLKILSPSFRWHVVSNNIYEDAVDRNEKVTDIKFSNGQYFGGAWIMKNGGRAISVLTKYNVYILYLHFVNSSDNFKPTKGFVVTFNNIDNFLVESKVKVHYLMFVNWKPNHCSKCTKTPNSTSAKMMLTYHIMHFPKHNNVLRFSETVAVFLRHQVSATKTMLSKVNVMMIA